jgi:glutamyl-tRNA reductase
MQLLQLGLDHRGADVGLRERLAIPAGELPEILRLLREQIAEGAILSTCNRTELYALVGHRETGRRATVRLFADARGVPVEAFSSALSERWGEDAARHLFRVTCGLESMIVGEHQILGQVRAAADAARAAGSAGPVMTRLLRDALALGKRARVESGIARSAVSVSSAAVELARKTVGPLEGRVGLVIGAGKIGSLAARSLADRGIGRLLVASRSRERAEALADRIGGEPLPLERLIEGLAESDVAICGTAAPGYIVTEEDVRTALEGRPGRPLILMDIAVPRDVEPSAGEIPGCILRNIDDLVAVREANLAARRLEAVKVEPMIEREVDKFMQWWLGREVAPTISDLVAQAEGIRVAELERGLARLGALSDRDRNAINALTTAIVNKMLHRPIVQLKQRGGHHDAGVYVHAVRELFGLPDRPGEAS